MNDLYILLAIVVGILAGKEWYERSFGPEWYCILQSVLVTVSASVTCLIILHAVFGIQNLQ